MIVASSLSSAPRGFAARSRVLARPVSLAQTGELARRHCSSRAQEPHAKGDASDREGRAKKAFSLGSEDQLTKKEGPGPNKGSNPGAANVKFRKISVRKTI